MIRASRVLTERALLALMDLLADIRASSHWRGPETPVFMDEDCELFQVKWLNDNLKRMAAAAQVSKPMTTHVLCKTAGTLIGHHNPKLAQQQLSISKDVFETTYFRPTFDDCIGARNILPGSDWKPTNGGRAGGRRYLALQAGQIDQPELQARIREARRQNELPKRDAPADTAYG